MVHEPVGPPGRDDGTGRRRLRGQAQIDHLKVLAAIVRKYGGEGAMIELTLADLRAVRGGLSREIDEMTGTMRWKFNYD
jgi:hypothetical protein